MGAGLRAAYECGICEALVSATQSVCDCGAERPRGGWALHPHLGRLIAERYYLTDKLGSGGSSEVFLAEDRSSETDLEPVVIKLLSGSSSDERRRFSNEARAARRLNSPHSVKIYDFGFDNGTPFLVMERLRGRTLRRLIDEQGPIEEARVVAISLQICAALAEAHEAGVVHRDIKPANLMLLEPGGEHVKVLDFGAARVAGPDATCSLIGTPRYMSPEQILEEDVDGRADIYALGICMFELLCGRTPYAGATAVESMNAHLSGVVPTSLRGDVRPALCELIERMLSRDRDARPASMGEVADALVGLANRRPVVRWPRTVAALTVAAAAVLWLVTPSAPVGGARAANVSLPTIVAPAIEAPKPPTSAAEPTIDSPVRSAPAEPKAATTPRATSRAVAKPAPEASSQDKPATPRPPAPRAGALHARDF